MGEDREKIELDEDEAVRSAVRIDDVEGHALTSEERDAVISDDDVEGHALISENLPDANLPDQAVRSE